MDDNEIITLYFERSQTALKETSDKYGSYCRAIAMNILKDHHDSEECLNDTWMKAWEAMPPKRPERLSAFLGRITRNLSISRWRKLSAQKRKNSEAALCIEELSECISDKSGSRIVEDAELKDALDRFLAELGAEARKIFMKRYWYMLPVKAIAKELSMNEGAVKMSLLRTRKKLRQFLEEEDIEV